MRPLLDSLVKGQGPDIESLLDLPPFCPHRSVGSIYARIALPLVPGLPILMRFGSYPCMTITVGGIASVLIGTCIACPCWRSNSGLAVPNFPGDTFTSKLLDDPELYAVTFVELFVLDGLDFTSASRKQLYENCITTVIVKSIPAVLTDAYKYYGRTAGKLMA